MTGLGRSKGKAVLRKMVEKGSPHNPAYIISKNGRRATWYTVSEWLMLCNCAAGRALQGKATWYCAQRADDSRVQSPDDGLPNTCVGGEQSSNQS
jgi:hypothetical protein